MRFALNGKPEREMSQPANVVTARINPKTGLVDKNSRINSITEYFRDDEIPSDDETPIETNTAGNQENQDSLF